MLSLREVIYMYRKFPESKTGKLSQNSFNSNTAILEYLRLIRATVVKEYIKAGISLPSQMYQTITCMKLVDTDLNDCPTNPPTGCYWLKSETLLPSYIQLTNVSAGFAGTSETFDHTDWEKIPNKLNSRVVGNIYTTKDTGEGTNIYLYNRDFLKSVSITGIFENPVEAMRICDKDCECDVLDQSFYVDRNIFNVILEKAWGVLPQVQSYGRENIKNDGLTDT